MLRFMETRDLTDAQSDHHRLLLPLEAIVTIAAVLLWL